MKVLKEGECGVNQEYVRCGLRDENAKGGRKWSKSNIYKGWIGR